MAKTIWAVACPVLAILALWTGGGRAGWPEIAPGGEATAPSPSAAAPAPILPPVPASLKSDDVYRIGPEDVLRISVWENKELTLDLVVRPDGKVSLPLIQDVQAEGLTAAELAESVHQRLEAYIKDPQVSVILLQVNAPKIFVIGNVAKPGPYPLRGETSVLQALTLAGGFSQFASPRSIKLVRRNGGKQEVRKLNYYDMIDEDGKGNHLLRPGDTIVVP